MPPKKPTTRYCCEICNTDVGTFSLLGDIRLFVAPSRLQDNSYTYASRACSTCRTRIKRAIVKEIELIDDETL